MADSPEMLTLLKEIITQVKKEHIEDTREINRKIDEIRIKMSENNVKITGIIAIASLIAAAVIKFFFDIMHKVKP